MVRTKLKIRSTPELSSTDIGDIAPGSCVRVTDSRELEDGTRRVCIAYEGKAPLGWVSCIGKESRHTLIDLSDPEAVTLIRKHQEANGSVDKTPRSVLKQLKYRFFSFQVNHATGFQGFS